MANEEMLGTVEWLVAELGRGDLVERARLVPLVDEFRSFHPDGDAMQLAEFLLERGVLTAYQVEKVMEGESAELALGPYLLAEPIGAGGMGVVYRALDRSDRRPFAVKVLPARGAWNLRAARKQVRAFADLPPHPAVVPCVDVGGGAGRQYLAWPLVSGETLESVVSRYGPFVAQDVQNLGLHLADGLRVAHERGIMHGLLRPSNVQLGEGGEVRLLDFGVGVLLVDGGREAVPADDQLGLGQVLLYALTGRTTPAAALSDDLPAGLAGTIARLLGRPPAGHFRHMADVLDALRPPAPAPVAATEYRPALDTPRYGALDETPPVMQRTLAAVGAGAPHLHGPAPDFAPRPHLPATRSRPPVTPPTSAAPREGARDSLLRGAFDRLTFWRTRRETLAVAVLAPASLATGSDLTLAVIAHRAGRPVKTLARTYFPRHQAVGGAPLRRPVARGARLTAHLALPGLAVEPPTQKFVWTGQPLPLPCSVHVPADFRPGEIVGVLSIAAADEVILNLEFRVLISGRE